MKNLFLPLTILVLILNQFNTRAQEWDPPASYDVLDPHYINYADFNQDGYVDMLILNYYSSSMTLMLNDGNGSFNISDTIETYAYPKYPVIDDFNNDGRLDFAQSHSSGYNNGRKVSVHLAGADGSFDAYDIYDVWGGFTYFVTTGDVNEDGFADIAVTSAGWPDGFSMLINNGDGSFTTGNHYVAGTETGKIRLVDINNDNHLDAVIGCGAYGSGYQVDVYFGDGNANFDNRQIYTTPLYRGRAYLIGMSDVEHDGDMDVLLEVVGNNEQGLYLMLNDGNGVFVYEEIALGGWSFGHLCDWNNDGFDDVVDNKYSTSVGKYLQTNVFLNDQSGNFIETYAIRTDTCRGYFAYDVNNDQLIDLQQCVWEDDSLSILLQIPEISTQTHLLTAGWNKISWNVIPDTNSMDSLLRPLMQNGSLVKAIDEQGNVMQHMPWGWENPIGQMQNTEGYWLKMTAADALQTVGEEVVFPFEIPLTAGWNIIAWPKQEPQDAMEVFQELIDAGQLIKVIDSDGNILQHMPWGWVNNIGDLKPAEGYQILSVENNMLTIQ